MMQVSDYFKLESLVLEKTGLKLDKSRSGDIVKAVNATMALSGLADMSSLLRHLSEHTATHLVWRQLIDLITVGETYFFRDSSQINALEASVLPQLIARRRATGFKYLSLWSAGCATGEEPYTLAMLLRGLLPDINDWTIRILGTDINQSSLEQAQRGLYRERSFRLETRSSVREQWFMARNNSWELNPVIRKMVDFKPLNLISDDYPAFDNGTMNVDLIICRNVTIYFEAAETRRIIERFCRALNEEGWLVVGHAEPLASAYHGFKPANFENAVLYQKAAESMDTPVPVAVAAPQPALLMTRSIINPAPAHREPVRSEDGLRSARAAAGRENWNELERILTRAERATPLNPELHYLRAMLHIHRNNDMAAMHALRRAIYCDARFVMAHYTLGEMHHRRAANQEACRCWQAALQSLEDRLPDETILPDDDLTVEMLRELLMYRLTEQKG